MTHCKHSSHLISDLSKSLNRLWAHNTRSLRNYPAHALVSSLRRYGTRPAR